MRQLLIALALATTCHSQTADLPYSQIIISAPDRAEQRENFWVSVQLADKNGQPVTPAKGYFINASANKTGIVLPPGDILIQQGRGGFWAQSKEWSGEGLEISVVDQHDITGVSRLIRIEPSPYASDLEKDLAELAILKKRPPTGQNMEKLTEQYGHLFQTTGDRQYLVDKLTAIKNYRAAFPSDQRFLYSLASAVDELDQDPREAVRLYGKYAAHHGWERRLQMYYLNVMRVEFYHHGTLAADELADIFHTWAADIDSLRADIESGPPTKSTYRSNLLERTTAEYHLWRADTALARGGDPAQALQWLDQAQASRLLIDLEKSEAHFDIYIHPRAELRRGDIAARAGDRALAQQHYRTAWNLLERYEESWSQERYYVYPDLRELHKLGHLIKKKID